VQGWLDPLLAVLATWRVSHLVAREDGPFDIVARCRIAAGPGSLGRLMDCPYCVSLWFAVPFAAWLARDWAHGLTLWLAISGGSCILEQVSALLVARAEPAVAELPPHDKPPGEIEP
jgi:hypothetical protein